MNAYFQRSARGSVAAGGLIGRWLLLLAALWVLGAAPPYVAQEPPMGGQQPKLMPLPHPEIGLPSVPAEAKPVGPVVAAVITAFLALAVLTWLLLRRSTVRPPALASPTKIALNRLIELRAESKKIPPAEIAGQVSIILREFQEAGFAVPAPYRTTEELYEGPQHAFEGVVKARFNPVAQVYDRLSFGAQPVTRTDALELIEKAMIAVSDDGVKDASAATLHTPDEENVVFDQLAATGTSARNLRFAQSLVFIILGAFALGLTWMEKLSPGGQSMAAAVGVLMVLVAAAIFRSALHTDPDARSFRPAAAAPIAEHLAYHRMGLIGSLLIFPLVSVGAIYLLNLLAHHAARAKEVMPPVAFFFRIGGYWPAVCAVPVLGLCVCVNHFLNLRRVLRIAASRP